MALSHRPARALLLLAPLLLSAGFVLASRAASPGDPPVAAGSSLALGANFQIHSLVPALAGDDAAGNQLPPTPSPTPTVAKTPTATPTPQIIPGGTSLTMQAGTGIIFSPFEISAGDRDVWWNGIEFVPGTGVEMQSLGAFTSASDLPSEPPANVDGLPVFVPSAGELFALQFPDRQQDGYTAHAFIWVSPAYKKQSGGHPIPFSYKYFPGQACGGTTAEVTALNKQHPNETVVVTGRGDMTGWVLESSYNSGPGVERFEFPGGFLLDGTVTIYSAAAVATVPPGDLWWTHLPMWDGGHNDDALLYNCEGTLVSTFDDGQ
jgi:hypothetical protein